MSQSTYTAGIYTLGCKVNQYESEAIAELLEARGIRICPPTQTCDLYVINTCTVTAESDRKARQFIRRAVHKNPRAYILVTGCLAQVDPAQIASIPGVDYVCSNAKKSAVADAALALIRKGEKNAVPELFCPPPDAFGFEKMQISRFGRTRAYVKIEDGCESHCSYCIIPQARGSIRSKAPTDVLEEVRQLIENGCREIVLTGIETASYGKDIKDCDLAELLTRVDRLPGIGRIRLGSLDPSLIKDDFVARIASLQHLAPHFHLSMQSGSDEVLARMKRKYNTKMALDAMQKLRNAIPGVQFTTDMIVGFPGETEQDFEKTLDFTKRAGFLTIHVFPYSKRKGTLAATMPDQIPEPIKHARVSALSAVQETIREKLLKELLGTEVRILPETLQNGRVIGHTESFIEVECPAPLCAKETELTVLLTHADSIRCYGEPIPENRERKG